MIPQQFDHIFQIKLASWIQFRAGYSEFFNQREIDLINRTDRWIGGEGRTIVLLAFENEYASLGGLSVVTKYLPRYMKQSGERIVFMTPFHANHRAIRTADKAGRFVARFTTPFECGPDTRQMTCLEDTSAEIPSYFLRVDGQFTAEEDPYHYSDPINLLLDSLVFCAAVPQACAGLGLTKNILFHAHDWEAAAVALTSKLALISGAMDSAKTVLTLHNSYDSPLPRRTMHRFFGKFTSAQTVLQAFIPLMNGPLSTVSTPFAHELRNDPLQRGYFTNHLLDVFSRNPPIGIENGAFGGGDAASPVPRFDSVGSVLSRKEKWHAEFRDVLSSYRDGKIIGDLDFSGKDNNVPVFFLSGRLDSMQKGFDTVFWAFQRLRRGSAKLLFSPNVGAGPGAAGGSDLDFFITMAKQCKGDISIWPLRIPQREYESLLRGAGFLVMPSFYEPFGAATEGLLAGTPVVARATGGLWIQTDPYDAIDVPQFYGSVLSHITSFSRKAATGILYREQYPETLSEENWTRIFELPLSERITSPLYEAIVQAAYKALRSALSLYHDKTAYATLISNGFSSLPAFDWKFAVAKYRKVYDAASRSIV
jgi:glycogen synthase